MNTFLKKIFTDKKQFWILLSILSIAFYLRIVDLHTHMMFIGDQAWFYMSARDMLLAKEFPLVGITSSHTWLHQGALWTYMLAPVLVLTNFHPVSGAYLTAMIGVFTVLLIYLIGKVLFSQRVGYIAAIFYATSPIIVHHARMSYHTSPIPTLTLLLFFVVYLWIMGNSKMFPFIVLLLVLLYNFELATFTLVPILVVLFAYGLWKKKAWVTKVRNTKTMLWSLIAFTVPMIPMLVYDVGHGFPQTVRFAAWVVYKIAVTLHLYPPLHPNAPGETYATMLPFAQGLIQKLLFLPHVLIASMFFIILGGFLLWRTITRIQQKSKNTQAWITTSLFFFIPLAGYIAAKTNSEGYVLIFFPIVAYMVALFFDWVLTNRRFFYLGVLGFLVITVGNVTFFIQQDYLMGKYGYGPTIMQREAVADRIVKEAKGEPYTIIGTGPWSQYESFTMPYEYLTWLRGNELIKKKSKLQFVVRDDPDQVQLESKRSR